MRPPWIEGAVLLAAHGHDPNPPAVSTTPWSQLMSQGIDFAFLPRLDAVSRPTVFTSLDALARHIERRRGQQAILLEEIEDLHASRRMATGDGPDCPPGLRDRGVQIHTLLLDGGRDRSLGFAWLKGGGRDALQAALCRAHLAKGQSRHALMHAA